MDSVDDAEEMKSLSDLENVHELMDYEPSPERHNLSHQSMELKFGVHTPKSASPRPNVDMNLIAPNSLNFLAKLNKSINEQIVSGVEFDVRFTLDADVYKP